MKKFIYTILLLLAVSLTAGAQSQFWANGIHYEATSETTLKVIAADAGSYSGVITIPKIAKITVMYMGSNMFGDAYERQCVVNEIDEGAFRDCTGLTGIVLPNTIQKIGKNAFYGCTGLTSLDLPYGLNEIGASAFAYCTGLTSVTVPNSVWTMGANTFYGCTGLTSATLPINVRPLSGTFNGCTALTSVTIPDGVTSLDDTFSGCSSLAAVAIPKSLTDIGASTFSGCTALTSVYLPNTVQSIGDMAFAYTGLTSLEIPATVTSLGENAFYGCTGLTSVTVRSANPPLMANSDAFSYETYSRAALYVPEATQTSYMSTNWWRLFRDIVGKASLENAYDFEKDGIYYIVTGPGTVSVTYKDTNYSSYTGTVNVPASVANDGVTYSVTGVGASAFRMCRDLTSVSLPENVNYIGRMAFYNAGLTGIDIPDAVTAIGDSAFYACTGLSDLTIPANVSSLGTNALAGFTVQTLTWNARECWSNGGMTTSSINSVVIGDEVRVLPHYFAYNSRVSSVSFPNTLTAIGKMAFMNANVKHWVIPENVTSIGIGAFDNNYPESLVWNARECWSIGQNYSWESPFYTITQLSIGDEVEVLPDFFANAARITSLTLPNSLKYIGSRAFATCEGLTDVVIPDAVEFVGDYAFDISSLSSITVGKGVKNIGCCAINGAKEVTWNAINCETMGLVYDYYDNNSTQWTKVTIGNEVERIPNFFAYRCKIKSLELPPSVKEIGNNAFQECSLLTNMTFPGSLCAWIRTRSCSRGR